MKLVFETSGTKKIITLADLTFGAQYFHSASLQVRPSPGSDQLDVVLILSLFVHNGMREVGTKGSTIEETVELFSKVTALTGGSPLSQLDIKALSLSKYKEIEHYNRALEEKHKRELEAAGREAGHP